MVAIAIADDADGDDGDASTRIMYHAKYECQTHDYKTNANRASLQHATLFIGTR